MRRLTSLAVATLLALGGVPAPPASGVGAITVTGTWRIAEFGIGPTTGQADLCVNGHVSGVTVTCTSGFNVHATFVAFFDPATCPVTGSASGHAVGALEFYFDWTMLGDVYVVSVPPYGNFTNGGHGWGVFAVTDPVGNPCAFNNVGASVAGYLAAH